MAEQTNNLDPLQLAQVDAAETSKVSNEKKPFVEPEISFPIDVLEATTFFVAVDSGQIP